MFRTLLFCIVAVSASASVNQVREASLVTPVKFQTVLDPQSAGCNNPIVDDEKSGVWKLDDGRFGVLILFKCGAL